MTTKLLLTFYIGLWFGASLLLCLIHCQPTQPANDPLVVSEEAINKLELECVKICPTIECSTDCRNTIRKAWASEHDVTITDLDANRHHYSKE